MISQDKYYQPPSDAIFNEIKEQAIAIWKTYDDTYGYQTEKLKRISTLSNIRDNAMFIVAMFDVHNQAKLCNALSEDAAAYVWERLPI